MMIRAATFLLVWSLLPLAATAAPKEKTPEGTVLVITKAGTRVGDISFKWVVLPNGKEFASSTASFELGGQKLLVRTHLERREDGRVEKYKKWIGLQGAKPALIAFWKGDKLRVVSEGKKKFTRTLDAPASFQVTDELAFHLLRDLFRAWKKGGDGTAVDVLEAQEGRFGTRTVKGRGTATAELKGRTVALAVIEVAGGDAPFDVYCDEQGDLWAVTGQGLTLVRDGATLGPVESTPSGAAGGEPPAPDPADAPAPGTPKPLPDVD